MSRITSTEPTADLRWPLVYVGIFLTTLATLLLELSLTRIFSVVFFHHLVFLAISIALFGLGAGGVFSYVVAGWPGAMFRKLGMLAVAGGVTVVAALTFLLTRSGEITSTTLAAVYMVSAIPFLLSGTVVSLAISESIERVERVYFYDLLGAAAGCLMLVPFLNWLGGPNTVLTAGVLFTAAAAVWFELGRSTRGRIVAVAVGLAMVGLVAYNARGKLLDVRFAKGQELRNEVFVKWNSFSRIAVAPEHGSRRMAIFIDADASTGIPHFDFDRMSEEEKRNLLLQGPGFPYAMRPGAKALIIGPGGGYDVSRAIASGSKDITGVEINPIIADRIMRGEPRLRALSRDIYFRPELKIFVEDGRSYVRRTDDKYQVLQATLVDTWASTAAGAFALSENNLYTVEAFEDYLGHLTEDGILAFTRWGFAPPRESLRLITLAVEALGRVGEKDFARHFIVARENVQLIDSWGATDTVLISRKPFSDADVERARGILAEAGMQAVYLPGAAADNAFARYLNTNDRAAFLDGYLYDVSPVTDNRPFFFYTVQPRDVWGYFTSARAETADYKTNRAVPLLFGLVGVSLAATILMLALPPLVLGTRLPSEPGLRRFLLFFVCVGIGYILVQVALIQKFVLFLGHPTYALTVIIFSMLISSGAGSYHSKRFARGPGRLAMTLIAAAGVIALLAFVVSPLAAAGVGWPIEVRMLVTVALIAPAGFLMGMPFPTALARLEERHRPSVRWGWSINAAASVLGSVLAIFFALYLGLRETLLIGSAMYAAAVATLPGERS